MILDMLDGRIARLTNTQSEFGVNFDSLSDLVVFGVAPALLIFSYFLSAGVRQDVAACVAGLYVLCGAVRLARFNVAAVKETSFSFIGMPIPAAAGILVTTFLVFQQLDAALTVKAFPLIVVAAAYLMISRVKYPSTKNIRLDSHEVVLLITASVLVFYVLRHFKEVLIFAGFWSYGLFGVIQHIHVRVAGFGQDEDDVAAEEIEEEQSEV
jgi:CDP-diacylglycerol--serine O-phosphatidyltransferase